MAATVAGSRKRQLPGLFDSPFVTTLKRQRIEGPRSTVQTVPLSKQDPIATLPRTSDLEAFRTPYTEQRQASPVPNGKILVPVIPRLVMSPMSPPAIISKTKSTLRSTSTLPARSIRTPKKVAVVQIHGTTMQLTPEMIKQKTFALTPISPDEAHPPMEGLLFRYSTDGDLNERGFEARKYRNRFDAIQEPPLANELCWTDVFYHIDRMGAKEKVLSPFISVTNCLIWVLRLALREHARHPTKQHRVSVISVDDLLPRSVYYILPYARQLKRTWEFTLGSWKYPGAHEFIVWKSIPMKAIIHTFRIEELFELCRLIQPLRDTLRFDLITGAGDLKTRIIKGLKQRHITLSPELVRAIANFAHLTGLRSTASIEHISHFVSEVVQGWGLKLLFQSGEEWCLLAATFANRLIRCTQDTDKSASEPALCDITRLKRGFLEGIAWSSSHFNARHSAESVRLTFNHAKNIGLGDPGKLLADELSGARMPLVLFDKKQQELFPGQGSRRLLLDRAYDEDDAYFPMTPATPTTPTPIRTEGGTMYDPITLNEDSDNEPIDDPDENTYSAEEDEEDMIRYEMNA